MASDKIMIIDSNNFEEEVMNSDVPVLVDFWAAWCGPCKMIAPIIEQLADDFEGKAKIAKVNVDEQSELSSKFRIMSIPTIMLFKDGKVVEQLMGARPKGELTKLIQKAL
ncbi:MAG TPA: thioredoxin [Clostridia bacterium]|nr:thioredoxin [Clostridia bacterium]